MSMLPQGFTGEDAKMIGLIAGCLLLPIAMYVIPRIFARPTRKPTPTAPPWPSDLPPLADFARKLVMKHTLPACRIIPTPGPPPEDFKATLFAQVRCGGRGEGWRECDGEPMVGLMQINVAEAPYAPPSLAGIAMITIFLPRGDNGWPVEWGFSGTSFRIGEDTSSRGIVVRAYPTLAELEPYAAIPEPPKPFKPCGASFERFDDPAPRYEELYALRDAGQLDDAGMQELEEEIAEMVADREAAIYGTKLGGWPAPIQDDDLRPLALQLGCEGAPGINIGDAGCIFLWHHIGKEGANWEIDWSCY